MNLQGPQWFGPYRLSARIATGGMAEIYLARRKSDDGRLSHAVAVKRLLPHLVQQTAVVQMFLNEAKITAQIEHPNVIRILDLGQEQGEPFIAMELLDGRTFAEIRAAAAEQGRRVPLGITLRILAEACRGLDAAHKARDQQGRLLCIVHRDFSPDNIHVGFDGAVRVIDFGIAKADNVHSGTEPGVLKGKFFYMSPEMISGAALDHRADLFAAGVMLYEQLCGRRPFTGMTTDEVLHRIGEGRPKRPSEFDPSVPPVLEAICLTALSHHPDGRFPSLSEFVRSLESVGGVAAPANQSDVATYVDSLFPLTSDKRRQGLVEARLQDRSVPDAIAPERAALENAPPQTAPLDTQATLPPHPAETPGVSSAAAQMASGRIFRVLRWAIPSALGIVAAMSLVVFAPWNRFQSAAQTPQALVATAESQLGKKDFQDALKTAETLSERAPQDVRGPLLEAQAAIGLRIGKRADAALDRAITLAPRDSAPHLLRAELRQLQGDVTGALQALSLAQQRAPRDRRIAARRAILLSKSNQLDAAATALSTLLGRRFDVPLAVELGSVRLRQSRPRDAVTILSRAVRQMPEHAEAQYYLGSALAMLGDSEGALRAYDDAAKFAPDDVRSLLGMCQVYAKDGRKAEAEAVRLRVRQNFASHVPQLQAECP
ncbi:MAG: protein kinase domain-containing protein [Myxococcaceae bacterium]